MSERRIDRVREILDRAMERPTGERAAFVAGAAGDNADIHAEVLSLLRALNRAGEALEPPPAAQSQPASAEPLTGLSFGPYVVGERIGEGGMGVVYATLDTRLGRTVAVKALPPGLARDPHRRARMEQEARLLASLNHPNIASIYGVEDTERGPVMILEFVPGRTLAEEIAGRRLAIAESVAIARQIARGLESAHGAGIVHRDLKPANIKLTPGGTVKILDLGVARSPAAATAVETGRDPWSEPVPRGAATQPGMIVGTAPYMSPEQARGRSVDRRTDLWALGCVLYEMLAGCRVFDGGTASDVVAAVLTIEPDFSRLPADTPTGVRRLLWRCLQKDPERRLRDAGDALLELDDGDGPPPSAPRPAGRWRVIGAATILAAIGTAAAWRWIGRTPVIDGGQTRFSIQTLGITAGLGGSMALSPDGRTLAYAAAGESGAPSRLYLRRLDSVAPAAIVGTDHGAVPFFSPDGRWIGFCETRPNGVSTLRRVPTHGGPAQAIAPGTSYGASWGDDDSIVFSDAPGVLWRVPAVGGVPVALGAPSDSAAEVHTQPDVLPGSRHVLFTCWRRERVRWRPRIESINIDTGERRVVVADGSQPCFARVAGVLVYQQGGSLMGVRLDPARLRPIGEPRRLDGPVAGDESGSFKNFAVSSAGTLAFVPGEVWSDEVDLAWFGLDGTTTTVYRGDAVINTLRLSPDGARVAFTTDGPAKDLWVLDLGRRTPVRLTSGGDCYYPVWTPDGTRIAFQRDDGGRECRIEWMPADGSAIPSRLYAHPGGAECFPTSFSPDGGVLAISAHTGPGVSDVFLVRLDGDRAPVRLLDSAADRVGARFSPDGTMIAYCSIETGRAEIYVHSFPALDRKILVSADGGLRPTWSGDSRRLFFRYLDRIYAAEISPPPALAAAPPTIALDRLPGERYDPSSDGARFLMGRPRGDWSPRTRIDVVTNALSPARR